MRAKTSIRAVYPPYESCVFVRSGGVWNQQAKLTASDGAQSDVFGWWASLEGNTAVIGAPGDEEYAGCAYVFVRIGGNWELQQKLTPSDRESWDMFGQAVAVDGDTALIGAPGDGEQDNYGAAYVFTRAGTVWTQQAKLTASDGAAGDWFGRSVSISSDGSYAIVGANRDDSFKGSAYIFQRSGTTWSEQAKLTASDGTGGDWFGWSVSISGDGSYAIVGAYSITRLFSPMPFARTPAFCSVILLPW